jgi:dTDP-4-dehydrorhamnose reductase
MSILKDYKKIAIIGSTGKVAEAVIRLFRTDETKTLHLYSGSVENTNKFISGLRHVKIDYNDVNQIERYLRMLKPDVILNLSAMTDVDGCESNPTLAWHLNAYIPSRLAKIAKQLNSKLIHISTDYVFDGEDGPYTEYSLCNPISKYGYTKFIGDSFVLADAEPNSLIVRTNVVYGYSEQGKSDFVQWVISKAKEGKPFNIVNDQYSNPTLTDDLAFAIDVLIRIDYRGIINVGGSNYCSRIDFVKDICNVFDLDSSLVKPITTESLNQPAKRPLKGGLNIDKLKYEIGVMTKSTVNGLKILKGYMDEKDRVGVNNKQ